MTCGKIEVIQISLIKYTNNLIRKFNLITKYPTKYKFR